MYYNTTALRYLVWESVGDLGGFTSSVGQDSISMGEQYPFHIGVLARKLYPPRIRVIPTTITF
ncbi:hypothetical protein [Virgibacillus chiguensis]|uniref:hypothetical protein n=1 Tax=Virgibacillus chiguensis TaxID=411959 RepID=UPI001BAF4B81|nr:hypothetical protein [Virgibacillus chiguensis]